MPAYGCRVLGTSSTYGSRWVAKSHVGGPVQITSLSRQGLKSENTKSLFPRKSANKPKQRHCFPRNSKRKKKSPSRLCLGVIAAWI